MPSDLTRPIIGIQNRTAQEVFDIMCDRFRALPTITPAEVGGLVDAQTEARAIVSAILVDERLAVGYQIETLADAIVEHIATALEPAAPEAAATDSIAVEICDAVMDWMVYRELIDTDQEYQPAEIVEALEGMFTDPTAAPEGQQPVAEAVEPSGNTGELIDKMAEAIRGDTVSDDTPWATLSEDRKIGWRGDAERALAVVKEYLTARLPAPEGHHPDDIAVDRFAAAMKEKLARKREEGVKKSAHGVRKIGATRAAEAGATVAELEALFGWTGGTMASHYTKTADRKRLAQQAAEKVREASEIHKRNQRA